MTRSREQGRAFALSGSGPKAPLFRRAESIMGKSFLNRFLSTRLKAVFLFLCLICYNSTIRFAGKETPSHETASLQWEFESIDIPERASELQELGNSAGLRRHPYLHKCNYKNVDF